MGDINCDTVVDAADLALVRGSFGTDDGGDADGDGITDAVDLGIVRTNFGLGTGGTPAPEPATFALFGLGCLLAIRRRLA